MRITLKDVEENVKPLGGRLSYDKEFIFELLAAYGRSQGNITRLRNGQLNVADDKASEVAQKGIVYLKPADVSDDELYTIVDDLKSSPTVVRYSTRFVIATNYHKLLAIDTKTGEPLDINIKDIDKHYAYFLPWAGMEKTQFIAENHADVKAAEKMAKLFDTLVAYNEYKTADDWHGLTVFFTRLLFCFFAEDTGIFQKNQFANAIGSYTQENGSDMHEFLLVLFEALDDEDKDGYPAYLAAFPYINGNLFSKDSALIPRFNKEARNLLIESSSKLDWSNINPDIFGSMFQAVVRPGERTGLGQHYTSVPNIMKTIEPLFLDDLKEEFDKAYDDSKKLAQLLGRISQIKVFDPACGSGNFLIIAYKEIRKLEHAILERQGELAGHAQQALLGSRINIENFYGIEIDDFAHEVAILSLWLAKHQMNIEFAEKFGIDLPLIPLKETGNIVRGNAAKVDWDDVCPKRSDEEVYLISNPPYLGSKRQDKTQKKDIELNFQPITTKYKDLDYIAIWFYKGAKFISGTKSKLAFVSTNSISQGTQVEMIWPILHGLDAEVIYAYNSFKWTNNAKGQAGVTCVIIALADKSNLPKDLYIFSGDIARRVEHINAYLTDGPDLIIGRRSKPLSSVLPKMQLGNMAIDDGNFFFTRQEKNELVTKYPVLANYLHMVDAVLPRSSSEEKEGAMGDRVVLYPGGLKSPHLPIQYQEQYLAWVVGAIKSAMASSDIAIDKFTAIIPPQLAESETANSLRELGAIVESAVDDLGKIILSAKAFIIAPGIETMLESCALGKIPLYLPAYIAPHVPQLIALRKAGVGKELCPTFNDEVMKFDAKGENMGKMSKDMLDYNSEKLYQRRYQQEIEETLTAFLKNPQKAPNRYPLGKDGATQVVDIIEGQFLAEEMIFETRGARELEFANE